MQSAWLESAAVLGLLVGAAASIPRLIRWPGWKLFWLASLAGLCWLGLLRKYPLLEMQPAFHWITAGRTEYLFYGPLTLWLLGLPAYQLPRKATRLAAATLAVLVSLEYTLGPFLGPIVAPPAPATLDPDGICIQTDSYSCGPAASVTALRRLGIQGSFEELAANAHTSQAIGTPPDLLCDALQKLYPVKAQYLHLNSLDQAPPGQLVLVLKLGLFVDHYVALLERGPDGSVEIGDPLVGRQKLSLANFEERWRHTAVVITRL